MPNPVTTTLTTDGSPLIQGEIRLIGGLNEKLFRLLDAIDRTGSINQAAKVVGLTYKGAWEMVGRANNLSPKLLVATAIGGKQGGGTRLTPAGKAFLNFFNGLQEEHKQFLRQLNQRIGSDEDIIFLLKRLIMKASARNQFSGKVSELKLGAVSATIVIRLKGGEDIVASITKDAAEKLGIKQGADVIALVKAPQVVIVTDFGGYQLSARNQLQGTVTHIQPGAVNSEVVIGLQGGDSVAATVTNESMETLGLEIGSTATAIFKASAVILGVAV